MRKAFQLGVAYLVAIVIWLPSPGQKKNLSYDQLFGSGESNVNKPLPAIAGWVDDEHYLELRMDSVSGNEEIMAINVKTGKASRYKKSFENNSTPSIGMLGLKNNEKNITFSPNGKWAAYTRNNNLFALEVSSKKEIQLTTDGSDSILNGYASWIYYEEILGRSSNYKAFWWSPDSKKIAYMRFDDSKVPVFPIYVADGQHGYLEEERFPKAGDNNPEVKIGIISVENTKTVWTDFNPKDDQYFGTPVWSPQGKLWVQWMNRGQDNLKIFIVDSSNGTKTEIYEEKQPTWVELDDFYRLEFLPSGKGFVVKSDKDGWENLYMHDITGKLQNKITSGTFWGTRIVSINEKTKSIFFRARKENSARFDFYKVGFDGKDLTRLSFGDFSHDQVFLSPGGKYFITVYSNLSTPSTMVLMDVKGKKIRELGNSKGAEFENYNIPETKIVRVKSHDGLFDLPIAITYPVNFDSQKRYPILISIYGGPNAGTVFDRWKPISYSTQWWAQEGIIQVAIDSRSSGHFGKKGLNYVYRNLGKWEIEDNITCAKWLRSQHWTDTNKIAITGGSFGGYLTCMALTYGSNFFTHGIANAPVTDWQLYDTHYTERFMDTPEENPEGYKQTSVMAYADRYKGMLRIVHGTSDDNVHMQNSLQLINVLQDLNKRFEFMVYPGERHTIGKNSLLKALHNRTEAYKFYYQYLLDKPLPEVFFKQSVQGF
jgi:dipeptidyl-peptidase-4